jgi:tyrosine-specific transport protein
MKNNHFIGGTLLVAGTTIGAGMLALPVITSFMGLIPSLALFLICWGFMLATAIFFIDVNNSIPGETNLITMASRTIGPWGKVVSWVVYLLLLYSLIAAYIAASSPLFEEAFTHLTKGKEIPFWMIPFCLPIVFGAFIYLGPAGVDLVNRVLMVGLILSYLVLVVFLPSHIQGDLLSHLNWDPFVTAFPVILTAFGSEVALSAINASPRYVCPSNVAAN